jgi:hypothetical protein
MMSSREGKWPNRHLRAIKHILELLLVVYSLHEKRCYKSSRPPGDARGVVWRNVWALGRFLKKPDIRLEPQI